MPTRRFVLAEGQTYYLPDNGEITIVCADDCMVMFNNSLGATEELPRHEFLQRYRPKSGKNSDEELRPSVAWYHDKAIMTILRIDGNTVYWMASGVKPYTTMTSAFINRLVHDGYTLKEKQ